MPSLDKDIHQKQLAIRFCLVNDMLPFPEVNVQNFRELSDSPTVITDIDVLGVRIDSTGRPRKVIFDCKTLGKTSPINRAFWAAGLMRFTECSEAFIILRKKASEAHRLSAKQIGVHLFDEKQFESYAESCSLDFRIDYCYSSDINNWSALQLLGNGNNHLAQFVAFLNNDIPLERDFVRALRKFLEGMTKVRGELDPAKPKHAAIYSYSLSIFAYLISQTVHDLRNIIDFDAQADQFEKLLKYYVWGGRDSFMLRNKMVSFLQKSNDPANSSEPELKNWPEFMELTRKLLDSPSNIPPCVFPLREIAFSFLANNSMEKDRYVASFISGNKRIRQFAVSMSKYLVEAIRLPKEFHTNLDAKFDSLRE